MSFRPWPLTGKLVAASDDLGGSVLRRLAQAPRAAVNTALVTPSRALRLAMIRAAQARVGMAVNVLGITEELVPLDDVLQLIEDEHLLLALDQDGVLCGLAGIDLQIRAAVIELQTTGMLRSTPADPRPVTATDAAMIAPLIAGFLAEVDKTTTGTALAGWTPWVWGGAAGVDHPCRGFGAAGYDLSAGPADP